MNKELASVALDALKLPKVSEKTKAELLELLLREEYGTLPPKATVRAEILEREDRFCAGKAVREKLLLCCEGPFGAFSFPFTFVYPKKDGRHPAFVHINFRDCIPDRYQPTEELIDEGFATLTFCYKDVSSDDGDFSSGLAGVVYPSGEQSETGCGKIGLWAWAAMRIMDYALTRLELDKERISVAGHSRLGKTALLTGALDERFFCAFSNDSGCGGAALSRGNDGETVEKITNVFPYWFCKKFRDYADKEETLPMDQHFLVAANLPHRVYVASAEGDLWACPKNEYLSCVAASEYYETAFSQGFVHPDRFPAAGERFHEGPIGYHYRPGLHYFSREDWLEYIAYLRKHFAKQ